MRAAAALLLLASGCGAPTEILVIVDSDLPPDLQGIEFFVAGDDAPGKPTITPCGCIGPTPGCNTMPVRFALVPDAHSSRRFSVRVQGFSDRACQPGSELIFQDATMQFVEDNTIEIYMSLLRTCVDLDCSAMGAFTCINGQCVDQTMPGGTPPDFAAVPDLSVPLDLANADLTGRESGVVPGARDLAGDDLAFGGGCFPAGTLVRVGGGARRPIQELEAGDEVVALDAERGVSQSPPPLARVAQRSAHVVDELLDLEVAGRTVTTTAVHPFWAAGRDWVPAGMLRPGDLLLRADGSWAAVERVHTRAGRFEVWDLEVEGLHTYYVTDLDLLVHNKATNSFGAGTPVWTSDGPVAIERLGPHMGLLGRDRSVPVRVAPPVDRPLLELRAGGTSLAITADHPLWVAERGWVPAGLLRPGDRIVRRDGAPVVLDGVAPVGRADTYHLEVEGDPGYYVSPLGLLAR